MNYTIEQLIAKKPDIQLILLGKITRLIPAQQVSIGLLAEHLYNLSFMNNPRVIQLYKSLDL